MLCQSCPRLVAYLDQVKSEYPGYFCQPVPAYGPIESQLLIVGLAPGKHGANASGIPFTGDASGRMLFTQLSTHGFAQFPDSAKEAHIPVLINCRITNAVKCLPPANKPLTTEVNQCNEFLRKEITESSGISIILALGHLAHRAVIQALSLKRADFKFSHGAVHHLPMRLRLVDSYHCSRYNVQTGRLTESMFNDVFCCINRLVDEA